MPIALYSPNVSFSCSGDITPNEFHSQFVSLCSKGKRKKAAIVHVTFLDMFLMNLPSYPFWTRCGRKKDNEEKQRWRERIEGVIYTRKPGCRGCNTCDFFFTQTCTMCIQVWSHCIDLEWFHAIITECGRKYSEQINRILLPSHHLRPSLSLRPDNLPAFIHTHMRTRHRTNPTKSRLNNIMRSTEQRE